MPRAFHCLFLMLVSPLASAQVVELGRSQLALATATVPTCTDSDGGAGASQAAASCMAQGYAAAASAGATITASEFGGTVSVFGEGSAASIGSPSNQTATGAGNGQAVVTWSMASDTHYSLSMTLSGGGTAEFSDGVSGPLPASGVLPADIYQLAAGANAVAQAQDSNGIETVTAGPIEALARVSFAVVGSTTLIRGTVLADGVGMPGLLVEARDGGSVVASTLTGDDGSYLLPGLPGTVTLRISDPANGFAPLRSGPLTPPDTFDADLEPILFADGFESPSL